MGADVVVLEEVGGPRRLPIWIGLYAGTHLALHLEDVDYLRPPTYAFTLNVLRAAGGRLREVRIASLHDQVLDASIVVEGPAGTRIVDARPQDALNLAVLADVPIQVSSAVLDAGGLEGEPPTREGVSGAAEIVDDVVWCITLSGSSSPPHVPENDRPAGGSRSWQRQTSPI